MSSQEIEFLEPGKAYDRWVAAQELPVHKGYYVEDLKKLELGRWDPRECHGAFLSLAGQEGISEARVIEIPPGKTLPPFRFAFDEIVFVVEGQGLTTVWGDNSRPKKTFEWQKHSMFMIPRNYTHQFSNMQGDRPARLLHYNCLPLAMSAVPDANFFFNSSYVDPDLVYGQGEEFYSQAKRIQRRADSSRPRGGQGRSQRDYWYGNFFPDMRSWDKLEAHRGRGAGGHAVFCRFPNSSMWVHMSEFPPQTYNKAHRHGPARIIVILAGEGYSIMWEEGKEKIVFPWHEGSVFVPPNRWFHQHFNSGGIPVRYLALHPTKGLAEYSERLENRQRDQIEYPDEEPRVREKFEAELTKRGLKSRMPEEAYKDRSFEWSYDG